jgi:hypothetical protein
MCDPVPPPPDFRKVDIKKRGPVTTVHHCNWDAPGPRDTLQTEQIEFINTFPIPTLPPATLPVSGLLRWTIVSEDHVASIFMVADGSCCSLLP